MWILHSLLKATSELYMASSVDCLSKDATRQTIYRFLLVLAAIVAYLTKTRSKPCTPDDNQTALSEYFQLVAQERWEAAFDKYLEAFFDSSNLDLGDGFALWKVRVGDAFMDIADEQKFKTAFCLAEILVDNRNTKSSERKKIRTTMVSLVKARSRHLVPSTHANNESGSEGCPDFKAARPIDLWTLLTPWVDAIRLYRKRKCPATLMDDFTVLVDTIIAHDETSPEEAKTLILLLLQLNAFLFFHQEQVDKWKLLLSDGDGREVEAYALRRCKTWVEREEWHRSLLQYRVYLQVCSRLNHLELGLLVMIQLRVALLDVSDTKRIDDAFDLAKAVMPKDYVAESEKEQCIGLVFDVLEARIKLLLSPDTVVHLDFFRDLFEMEIKVPFLVRLEICTLWSKFLKICARCNQDPSNNSPMPRLFTQLIKRETDEGRAMRMVKFVQEHNPDMSDYNPAVVQEWKRKQYLE